MRWPPNKSWTSTSLRKGFRHFVAINYGGKGPDRWVLLVSVLDGKSRFRVPWVELKDISKWHTGWLPMSRDEANPIDNKYHYSEENDSTSNQTCLHASRDSGLLIPSSIKNPRPWFEE